MLSESDKSKVLEDRKLAKNRHDLDSGIFQGRYVNYKLGRFTDEFIYGRYQIFEEVKNDLKRLKPNAKVLDLGCGTGHLSKYIKDKGFEVIGLDPSLKMLQFAKNNFSDISFVEGISANLPFEDNLFDYVVSIEVLRYLNAKDVEKTYKEILRILKDSGFFNVTHVNKYAFDMYFIFYNMKKFLIEFNGQKYHNCYFTTSNKETKLIGNVGFKEVKSVGRMDATIRIAYKFGSFFGRLYSLLKEIFNKKQIYKGPLKENSGHLIIRGFK
tara:strand:- start:120 stop:926 length:807 start_codon:yes stop_codon:yes gene_type:complete